MLIFGDVTNSTNRAETNSMDFLEIVKKDLPENVLQQILILNQVAFSNKFSEQKCVEDAIKEFNWNFRDWKNCDFAVNRGKHRSPAH